MGVNGVRGVCSAFCREKGQETSDASGRKEACDQPELISFSQLKFGGSHLHLHLDLDFLRACP